MNRKMCIRECTVGKISAHPHAPSEKSEAATSRIPFRGKVFFWHNFPCLQNGISSAQSAHHRGQFHEMSAVIVYPYRPIAGLTFRMAASGRRMGVSSKYPRIAMDFLGLLWTQKKPEPLIFQEFPTFFGLLWIHIWCPGRASNNYKNQHIAVSCRSVAVIITHNKQGSVKKIFFNIKQLYWCCGGQKMILASATIMYVRKAVMSSPASRLMPGYVTTRSLTSGRF